MSGREGEELDRKEWEVEDRKTRIGTREEEQEEEEQAQDQEEEGGGIEAEGGVPKERLGMRNSRRRSRRRSNRLPWIGVEMVA